MIFTCVKRANTKIQLHKYTNTQIHKYGIWQSARKTQHVVYFWKEDCSRVSKIIFPCVKLANTKIQIQNTQIHKYSIWRSSRKTQPVVHFWKEDCSRVSKMIFPCVKRTNTNTKYTNTQIQHMMKCQKDPTCGIFLKGGLFKGFKNYISMCPTRKYKNANTQIHKYSIWQSARKTERVVYFWKDDCSRISKVMLIHWC